MSDQNTTPRPHLISPGAVTLVASVMFYSAAHLLLRRGAIELSAPTIIDLLRNWRLIVGLGVYGMGTLLWLYCLSKLELSVAFPASALQFILVLAGARWILGEQISGLRLLGAGIILAGITVLSLERKARHA